MTLTILASSSEANCAVVRSATTTIMVDAGLPYGPAFKALAGAGINPESLSGVLLTHEHQDHSRGAEPICSKLRVPIYCTRGTADTLKWPHAAAKSMLFLADESFLIGDIWVVPFAVPHDAAEPVGFYLSTKERSIAIATDLGHVPEKVAQWLIGSDLVMIESSYEPDVLLKCEHDPKVKRRVISGDGHLSNELACNMISRLDARTSTVVLAHLSARANDPEIATLRAKRAMNGFSRRLALASEVVGEAL